MVNAMAVANAGSGRMVEASRREPLPTPVPLPTSASVEWLPFGVQERLCLRCFDATLLQNAALAEAAWAEWTSTANPLKGVGRRDIPDQRD